MQCTGITPGLSRGPQVEHVKAERNVLAEVQNPYIVKLYYSFQVGRGCLASMTSSPHDEQPAWVGGNPHGRELLGRARLRHCSWQAGLRSNSFLHFAAASPEASARPCSGSSGASHHDAFALHAGVAPRTRTTCT